jgi:hypothetical protein
MFVICKRYTLSGLISTPTLEKTRSQSDARGAQARNVAPPPSTRVAPMGVAAETFTEKSCRFSLKNNSNRIKSKAA